MMKSVKFEVVIGVPDDEVHMHGDKYAKTNETLMIQAWMNYAKEFFKEHDCYVSAIAVPGKAVYNMDWGCPLYGERVVTFHCTANPIFIKDLFLYEEGLMYITKKLKEQFHQNTITITRLEADVCYLAGDETHV